MSASNALIRLEHISKQYDGNDEKVLDDISLDVYAGESLAIVGPSGCGKSTLLNLIGTLDEASSGSIYFNDQVYTELDANQQATIRNNSIGFVFQSHHLLPQCTALENVLVPTLVNGSASGSQERAEQLLDRVGLSHRIHHTPAKLSGGERQRVAVVRALINKPAVLLADEPTGSLSTTGSGDLTQLLLELNQEEGLAMIVATHAPAVAEKMGRILRLDEGKMYSESSQTV
jgi:lipoprotein-releasing system ATP-binding protein